MCPTSQDPVNFPQDKVAAFAGKVHAQGQHYVVIVGQDAKSRAHGKQSPKEQLQLGSTCLTLCGPPCVLPTCCSDPGIHNETGYAAWDAGLAANVFTTESDGRTPYIGKVWPGTVGFPDFLHVNASSWWSGQISSFLDKVPYDGLWIDMNELSNFVDGSVFNTSDPVNHPPYKINNCEENTRHNGPPHHRSRRRMCAP